MVNPTSALISSLAALEIREKIEPVEPDRRRGGADIEAKRYIPAAIETTAELP